MMAIVWIVALMASSSLAYEVRPFATYKRNGQDQGYGLPAQGYAIPPASDYSGSVLSGGYGAPVASQGYGAPAASYGPSYQIEAEYPEEESKWAKLPGMFQKAIKGSMDKQKERLESMKEMAKHAGQLKKEMTQQLKEQIKEHIKSKKPEPEPYYPAPVYSAPAPAYSAYPASSYSAPAYQTPVYSAPTYQAPAPVYQAPTPSYSASSYSAPFIPSDPLPVPYPVATPSSYQSSQTVVLPSPSSYGAPSVPIPSSDGFASNYGSEK